MKNRLLYAGIILAVAGFVGRVYAAGYTHIDAEGILRDSAWLPIGSLMFVFGVVLLVGIGVQTLISSTKKR